MIAHHLLAREWVELTTINQALRAKSDIEDEPHLGQQLIKSGQLNAKQLSQLMAGLPRDTSANHQLEQPPQLEVYRDRGRVFLVDASQPKQLGKYMLLELIGSGGMGTIYRAYNPDLERIVALKLIRPLPGSDTTHIQRFRREARMAARLEHPGIVRVWDVGREKGLEYIVMDLVDGATLERYIADNTPSITDRLRLVQRVSAAVGHAHRHGVIHRDLKPSWPAPQNLVHLFG